MDGLRVEEEGRSLEFGSDRMGMCLAEYNDNAKIEEKERMSGKLRQI